MAGDKIKISLDDVRSADVDAKIKRQEYFNKAQVHQQQVYAQPAVQAVNAPSAASGSFSIWRNSILSLALFGLIGGLFAWVAGEVVQSINPKDYQNWIWLHVGKSKGKISEQQYEKIISDNIGSDKYCATYADSSISWEKKQRILDDYVTNDQSKTTILGYLFWAICGIFIGIALSCSESVISKNWHDAVIYASLGALLGLIGGIVSNATSGPIYGYLGGGQYFSDSYGTQIFARAVAWAIVGPFVAIAPGILLRNLKKLITCVIGGFLGGLIGGALFDIVCSVTGSDVFARFIGIIAIGVCAGIGIGLIENALKSGWLKVVAGLITGKQFIIYRNPTCIGSSPQSEIYLFKDPSVAPRHALLHTVSGGFAIENVGQGVTYVNGQSVTKARLKNNDQVQIGQTIFSFQEKVKQS